MEGGFRVGSGEPESGVVGGCFLIQITPQLRILVAIEPIDAHKRYSDGC
jgi:hypothetical protein